MLDFKENGHSFSGSLDQILESLQPLSLSLQYIYGTESEDFVISVVFPEEENYLNGVGGDDLLNGGYGSVNPLNPGADLGQDLDDFSSFPNGDLIGSAATQDFLVSTSPGTSIHILGALENTCAYGSLDDNHRFDLYKTPVIPVNNPFNLSTINIGNVFMDLKPISWENEFFVHAEALGITSDLLGIDKDNIAEIISQNPLSSDNGLELVDVCDLVAPERLMAHQFNAGFFAGETTTFGHNGGDLEAFLLVARNGEVTTLTENPLFPPDEELPFDDDNFDGFSIDSTEPVNNAPEAGNSGFQILEDGMHILTSEDFTVSDTEDGKLDLSIELVSLPGNGTLFNDGISLNLSDNSTFSMEDVNNGLVTFVPDENNGDDTSFDFNVLDSEGAPSLSTGTFSINVTPVADSPELSVSNISTTAQGIEFDFMTRLVDLDEILSLQILTPTGVTVEINGEIGVSRTAPDSMFVFPNVGDETSGHMTITQDEGFNSPFTVTLGATSTEGGNGDTATTELNVIVGSNPEVGEELDEIGFLSGNEFHYFTTDDGLTPNEIGSLPIAPQVDLFIGAGEFDDLFAGEEIVFQRIFGTWQWGLW